MADEPTTTTTATGSGAVGDGASKAIGEASSEARVLSAAELQRIADDAPLAPHIQRRLLKDRAKSWDIFYKRNSTKAYKDRHWIVREFPELTAEPERPEIRLLETGCGVGNTVFPLLEDVDNLFVHCCDLSPRAIEFVKAHEEYNAARCHAFTLDLLKDNIMAEVPAASCDFATLFFVLGAMALATMPAAVANIARALKPGGMMLYRDHGLYDHAMLRFKNGHKLEEQFYVRSDGTFVYYASLDEMRKVFEGAGLEVRELCYVHKKTVNVKEGVDVPRVFVQGKLVKPAF